MKKISRNNLRLKRKRRIRAKIFGTAVRPRLAVFKSLLSFKAQVIDDEKGQTLVFGDIKKIKTKNDIPGAKALGQEIAKLCKAKGIEEVVFDRSGYKFHGKVMSFVEGARAGGLKF